MEKITITYQDFLDSLTKSPEGGKVLLLMPGGNQKFNFGCDSTFHRKEITTDERGSVGEAYGYCEDKRYGLFNL